jgi:DNA anti-recombination protein RmuC
MNWGRTEAQQRWFDEAERQEEERAHCRRELKREEQRAREQHSIDQLRAEVQREIAALRSEMTQQGNLMLEAAGQALGEISNKILDRVEGTVDKIESELRILTERRFGEAMGRLDAILPDRPRPRPTKDFRFANETDDGVVDLPNPLVYKTTMN